MSDAPAASVPVRSRREILTVMSGLMLAMLLAMLDNTIVSPALPTIVGDLGGLEHLSWVITAYTLATAVSTLLWGKFGDLFGRKGTFLASIVVFVLGSALTGLSQNMGELIAFRAVQGIGAGGLIVGVMAIIGELIPPADRPKYQGVLMAVMPVAMLGGPLVGGWITDNLSWHWAFYVNVPLGVLALATVWFTMHSTPRDKSKNVVIDWWGALALAIWSSALVLLGSWAGGQYAWGSWQVIALGVVAVIGFVVFIAIERRVAEPLLPLHLFANRNFALAGVLSFVVGLAMMGTTAYLPQFQQLVQGSSATNSGLLLLPMMIPMMVMSLLVGQLMSKTGKMRVFGVAGGIVLVLGMVLMTTIDPDTTRATLSGLMVVLGIGIGILIQPSTLVAQNSTPLRNMGAGMGASRFLQTMGMSLGTAVLGTIYTTRMTNSLSEYPGGEKLVGNGAQLTPEMVHGLPGPLQNALHIAVSAGMQGVFWAGAIVGVVALLVGCFIRDVPLSKTLDDTAVGVPADGVDGEGGDDAGANEGAERNAGEVLAGTQK